MKERKWAPFYETPCSLSGLIFYKDIGQTSTSSTGPTTDDGVCDCHRSSGSVKLGAGLYFHSPTRPLVVPPASNPEHNKHVLLTYLLTNLLTVSTEKHQN